MVGALLGFVFVLAGLQKILRPYEFLQSVYDYRILGDVFSVLLTATLPAVEFVAGLALVLGRYKRGARWIAILLLGGFFLAQVHVMHSGLNIDCGCFNFGGRDAVGWQTLLRTGLMFGAALFCLAVGRSATHSRRD